MNKHIIQFYYFISVSSLKYECVEIISVFSLSYVCACSIIDHIIFSIFFNNECFQYKTICNKREKNDNELSHSTSSNTIFFFKGSSNRVKILLMTTVKWLLVRVYLINI